MVDYDQQPNGRAWCYTFQFKGKLPAMAGTVFVRMNAPHQEVEAECLKHWRRIFPDNLECPLVQLVPGMLVFLPEKSQK